MPKQNSKPTSQLFPEYLGDVRAEALLQNLTNINVHHNSIAFIRDHCKAFTVEALYDVPGAGTEHPRPDQRQLVRLVLTVSEES
jgi:hypothetical protein